MNQLRTLLTFFTLAVCFLLTGCGDDEEGTPSAPLISSNVSLLPVQFGETKSFDISVSAAGKLKEVTATVSVGSVTVTEVAGVGANTGTAKINYTAPFDAGTGKITIKVLDQANQEVIKEVNLEISALPPMELEGGDVEGEWGPSRTYIVRGDLNVPAGKTLTVREGVTVIVDGDGTQGNSPSIVVRGKFYSYGTPEKPVLFSVAEANRTQANIFAGLWGGILATSESPEMAVNFTRIEYAGGPAEAGSPIVTSGELEEGDPCFGLYFNNPDGKFVMMHSTIAYTKDDGMRVNQGKLVIAYNTYYMTGKTGGEALNVKSGSTGDIAYNVFFQAATNGVKWSNSDDRTPQNDVNVYNNTAINCGWRQAKAGRGGSFNLEKGGRGKVYNNMAINCRFGVRFPKAPDNPDVANSAVGYNLYYGNHADIVTEFYPSVSSFVKGDFETANDVSSTTVGENDPKFVSYTVTTFDYTTANNPDNITFPAANMDFRLQAGSPALAKGKTNFTTKYNSHTVDGTIYNVPPPSNFIGALGN